MSNQNLKRKPEEEDGEADQFNLKKTEDVPKSKTKKEGRWKKMLNTPLKASRVFPSLREGQRKAKATNSKKKSAESVLPAGSGGLPMNDSKATPSSPGKNQVPEVSPNVSVGKSILKDNFSKVDSGNFQLPPRGQTWGDYFIDNYAALTAQQREAAEDGIPFIRKVRDATTSKMEADELISFTKELETLDEVSLQNVRDGAAAILAYQVSSKKITRRASLTEGPQPQRSYSTRQNTRSLQNLGDITSTMQESTSGNRRASSFDNLPGKKGKHVGFQNDAGDESSPTETDQGSTSNGNEASD